MRNNSHFNNFTGAYWMVFYPICFLLFFVNSCNYYLPLKSSQLGYQKENNYIVNGVKLIKFNPKTLEDIIQKNPSKSIFIIYQHDNSCAIVAKRNKEILKKFYLNDTVFLIPIVHDYLMDFKNLCKIDTTKIDRVYYTDVKIFGKTSNSIKGYEENVIGYFDKSRVPFSSNYIFSYKKSQDLNSKKIVLYSFGNNDLDSLIQKSTKFEFNFR